MGRTPKVADVNQGKAISSDLMSGFKVKFEGMVLDSLGKGMTKVLWIGKFAPRAQVAGGEVNGNMWRDAGA